VNYRVDSLEKEKILGSLFSLVYCCVGSLNKLLFILKIVSLLLI